MQMPWNNLNSNNMPAYVRCGNGYNVITKKKQRQLWLTAGPFNPKMNEIRPAETLNGVPVAEKGPILAR